MQDLRFTAVVLKSPTFWDITLCSPFKVNRRLGKTRRLHLQGRRTADSCLIADFTLVSCLVYSSALKMEETFFSETSVDFQLTTQGYIPHRILQLLFIMKIK
jgi:hypothetical protein